MKFWVFGPIAPRRSGRKYLESRVYKEIRFEGGLGLSLDLENQPTAGRCWPFCFLQQLPRENPRAGARLYLGAFLHHARLSFGNVD